MSGSEAPRPDHPSLLPALLAIGADDIRRSARAWAVGVLCFLLATGFGVFLLFTSARAGHDHPPRPLDVAGGAVACQMLWVRRRWPVPLSVGTSLFAVCSLTSAGAPR